MKRLLALLFLIVSPAFAQQIDYTYTQTPVGAPTPLEQLNQNQGTPLNLWDDQVSNPINLGFEFTFYGQKFSSAFISSNGVLGFQSQINGCCSGYNLANPGNKYGIFALQTDLINLQTINPWYKTEGIEGNRTFTIGWYDMPIFYDGNFRSTFEITLYENNNNVLLNYGNLNTGDRFFTAGLKGDNGEYELLYSGTNDNFLENTSFLFSFTPPPSPKVDCATDPANLQCTLLAITETSVTDIIFEDTSAIVDSSTTDSNDESSVEESLAASTNLEESLFGDAMIEEVSLEETLAADSSDERNEDAIATEDMENETQEEIENKLVDAIDPSILSLVLSIVDATSVVDNSGAKAGQSSAVSSSSSSTDFGSGNSSVSFVSSVVGSVIADSSMTDLDPSNASSTGVDSSGNIIEISGEASFESAIELQVIAASISSSNESTFDEKPDLGFPTLSLDPNNPLSQFINNMPSIANQEAAGVFGNRQDKSDAEVRAEQVVAANKEEQDAINANYMDADQSGIVVAMGSDVDFTSYKTASLQDANLWYKPEDIYKNVVLKDNVRGSYFLEKGSTDTYKKMVEEQYK